MAWRRRYGRSRYRRRRFSRGYGRRRYGSRRRYRRRISRTTRSSAVKLTYEDKVTFSPDGAVFAAYKFTPSYLPGFSEYTAVYSEFRILRARLLINKPIAANETNAIQSYLIVSSQPFADLTKPYPAVQDPGPTESVPNQSEDALRQTRWQRLAYPSSVRQYLSIRFRPYTMRYTLGPVLETGTGAPRDLMWARRHDAKRWMPIQWATSGGTAPNFNDLAFYGPYVVPNTAGGTTPAVQFTATLEVYVQFRGQK